MRWMVSMKIQKRRESGINMDKNDDHWWLMSIIIGWNYSKDFVNMNLFEVLHPRRCRSLHFTNEDAETVSTTELGQGHRARGQPNLIPIRALHAWTEMGPLRRWTWRRSWDFPRLFLFPWSSSVSSRDCPCSSATHCWVTLGRVTSQASVLTSVNAWHH